MGSSLGGISSNKVQRKSQLQSAMEGTSNPSPFVETSLCVSPKWKIWPWVFQLFASPEYPIGPVDNPYRVKHI